MSAELLSQSLTLALPELILAGGAMVLLMIGVFAPADRANSTVTGLAVAVLIGVLGWMLLMGGRGEAFGGAYVQDGYAAFMKTLTLIGSIVALAMSVGFARAEKFDR